MVIVFNVIVTTFIEKMVSNMKNSKNIVYIVQNQFRHYMYSMEKYKHRNYHDALSHIL